MKRKDIVTVRKLTPRMAKIFIALEETARGTRLYSIDTTKRRLLKSIDSGSAYLIENDGIPVGTIICSMKKPDHAYLRNC